MSIRVLLNKEFGQLVNVEFGMFVYLVYQSHQYCFFMFLIKLLKVLRTFNFYTLSKDIMLLRLNIKDVLMFIDFAICSIHPHEGKKEIGICFKLFACVSGIFLHFSCLIHPFFVDNRFTWEKRLYFDKIWSYRNNLGTGNGWEGPKYLILGKSQKAYLLRIRRDPRQVQARNLTFNSILTNR